MSSLSVKSWLILRCFNTLRPEQNGWYFTQDFSNAFFSWKYFEFHKNYTAICSSRSNSQIDGLVQERCNPSALTWSYVFHALSHWNIHYYSLRPSVRPSVPRPSRIPCPLCSFYSSGWIHFIFIHLIKQLQVCRVQSYLQNFKIWSFGNFCVVWTWDLMWITSVGNHGAAGGISERRRSSCSSWFRQWQVSEQVTSHYLNQWSPWSLAPYSTSDV